MACTKTLLSWRYFLYKLRMCETYIDIFQSLPKTTSLSNKLNMYFVNKTEIPAGIDWKSKYGGGNVYIIRQICYMHVFAF